MLRSSRGGKGGEPFHKMFGKLGPDSKRGGGIQVKSVGKKVRILWGCASGERVTIWEIVASMGTKDGGLLAHTQQIYW